MSVSCPAAMNSRKITIPTSRKTEAKTVMPTRARRPCLTRLATS